MRKLSAISLTPVRVAPKRWSPEKPQHEPARTRNVRAPLDAAEREMKRQQVTLLVRIKNKLTPEQQAKLSELRSKPAGK
jgi:Spy/CpxP family protein refolding chaperone